MHEGPIKSPVPGRTDHVPLSVEDGAYVIPADIVSALGEGNTEAGHRVLDDILPAPIAMPARRGAMVEIMAAGGEHVVPPGQVMALGQGDLETGHRILDAFVRAERKRLVTTLKTLPGPVKG